MFSSKSDSCRQLRTLCDIFIVTVLQLIIFLVDYDQDIGEFSKSKIRKNIQLDAIVCSRDNFQAYGKKYLRDVPESDVTLFAPFSPCMWRQAKLLVYNVNT
jgi:hypothetical protein